jgi:hypothetical protein
MPLICLPYLNDFVGIDLVNGESVTGKFCRFDNRGIYLLQRSYQQFTTRFYLYDQIQSMSRFPTCYPIPTLY